MYDKIPIRRHDSAIKRSKLVKKVIHTKKTVEEQHTCQLFYCLNFLLNMDETKHIYIAFIDIGYKHFGNAFTYVSNPDVFLIAFPFVSLHRIKS